jgi:uncharacterized XkdX family phage protein
MSFWAMAYKYGWATKAQLQEAVSKGKLTAVEYKQITGEDYEAT